jgi:hypothetical protein
VVDLTNGLYVNRAKVMIKTESQKTIIT